MTKVDKLGVLLTFQPPTNDYKRYCKGFGFFNVEEEMKEGEDGAIESKTKYTCVIGNCGCVFSVRKSGGYTTAGKRIVSKHRDILVDMLI